MSTSTAESCQANAHRGGCLLKRAGLRTAKSTDVVWPISKAATSLLDRSLRLANTRAHAVLAPRVEIGDHFELLAGPMLKWMGDPETSIQAACIRRI